MSDPSAFHLDLVSVLVRERQETMMRDAAVRRMAKSGNRLHGRTRRRFLRAS